MLVKLTTTDDKQILVNPNMVIAVRARKPESDEPYSSVKMIDGKEFDVKESFDSLDSLMV